MAGVLAALERLGNAPHDIQPGDLTNMMDMLRGVVVAADAPRSVLELIAQLDSDCACAEAPIDAKLAGVAVVARQLSQWFAENPYCPGRGYSKRPRRAPHTEAVGYTGAPDKVGELRSDPYQFQREFGLTVEEFDCLLVDHGAGAQIEAELPRRIMTTENRLAMFLRQLRTRDGVWKNAAWFGIGNTTASKDINDIGDALYCNPRLRDEIGWPSPRPRTNFASLSFCLEVS
jgi:hypothetical protein